MLHSHSTTNKQENIIYVGSKIAGKVQGDTFYKTVKPQHFLQRPPAIAFDVSVLDQATKAGAVKVVVTDSSTGTQYISTIEHIREAGFYFNRGYGDQVGLTFSGWIRTRRGQLEQLDLFVGSAA